MNPIIEIMRVCIDGFILFGLVCLFILFMLLCLLVFPLEVLRKELQGDSLSLRKIPEQVLL